MLPSTYFLSYDSVVDKKFTILVCKFLLKEQHNHFYFNY